MPIVLRIMPNPKEFYFILPKATYKVSVEELVGLGEPCEVAQKKYLKAIKLVMRFMEGDKLNFQDVSPSISLGALAGFRKELEIEARVAQDFDLPNTIEFFGKKTRSSKKSLLCNLEYVLMTVASEYFEIYVQALTISNRDLASFLGVPSAFATLSEHTAVFTNPYDLHIFVPSSYKFAVSKRLDDLGIYPLWVTIKPENIPDCIIAAESMITVQIPWFLVFHLYNAIEHRMLLNICRNRFLSQNWSRDFSPSITPGQPLPTVLELDEESLGDSSPSNPN